MEPWLIRRAEYLLAQSWQIAVLTIAVALASLLLRNRSAHVRYLLWLIVLAKCLVPPLYSIPVAVLPPEEPPVYAPAPPIAERMAAEDRVPKAAVTESAAPASVPSDAASFPRAIERPARYDPRAWLALGWLAGVVALSFYYLLNALRTQIWLQRRRKALPRESRSDIESFFAAHGVRRMPRVWLLDRISQPFVWGLVRGSIHLPAGLLDGKHAKCQASLLGHELSHVLRFDALINSLQVLAQTVFWFHPFVWWANRRIRAEREKCCDEMTIARWNTRPEEYSEAIVETLAAKYEQARPVPSLAVAGQVKNIEERIDTMLRPGKRFHTSPSLAAAIILLMVAFLIVPTAIVLTARAEAKAASESRDKRARTMHEAAAAGDVNQVNLLLSKGADVNARDKDGRTPLHWGAWSGRKDVAEVLIAKGTNINETDVSGQTPLHVVARFGLKSVPELLLAKGANVNARDKAGNTPLHSAASPKYLQKELLELLLAKGADINARNDRGQTPLHFAARSDRKASDVVEFLLANGADINAKDRSGCTPLYVAAGNGSRKETVELLLNKGADIRQKNDEGMTALYPATIAGNKEIIKVLLNKGLEVNSTQSSGWTVLHYAARAGNNNIVEFLISNRAEVNARSVRGETPAHLAAVHNHKDTVKLLVSKGAEVSSIHLAAYVGDLVKVKSFIEKGASAEAQDGHLLTPLHAAAGAGQREIAEFLISKGASVNADAVAEGPGTPLHYAIDGGSKEVVELLISKGADIDASDKYGITALHRAATKGDTDIVKLLIARGANVNAKTQYGQTPLHYAAQTGHKDVVEFLIDNGADVNVEATNKLKPLHYAARSYHGDVVKLLIDKGTNISKDDSLFYYACIYGHRDLAELLIKKGADVNPRAWDRGPLLLETVWNAYTHAEQPDIPRLLDILRLLLDNGADPNAKDRWDWSLLHYTQGNVDLTRLLLDKGANPNAIENERGLTPLHFAAEPGRKAMVELLISRGANVNAKDYCGRTPLSYAEDLGSNDMWGSPRDTSLTSEVKAAKKEVAELLRKHGAKE